MEGKLYFFSPKLKKLLIIDDNEDLLIAAKLLLVRNGYEVTMEKNPLKIPFLLNNHRFDGILLDMNFEADTMSGNEGFQWLKYILEKNPQATVVMITAYGDVEMAVKAIKMGATDFVLKPWQNEKLVSTVEAAINKAKVENTQQKPVSTHSNGAYLAGESLAMKQVESWISKVAPTDANILILGENGTGKEMLAKEIHRQSHRNGKPFVGIDVAAIPEQLFESELFGYKKGAFTDAKEDKPGRFEQANGGTLFLDEIGNLNYSLQGKLLTAIQRKEIFRLGSSQPVAIDVRLICATNADLYQMVEQNTFRRDLLYRINTLETTTPPLRERKEDIKAFAKHFIEIYKKQYAKPDLALTTELLQKLNTYHWPGNVRELQHTIERIVIMSTESELFVPDFNAAKSENGLQTAVAINEMEKNMITSALSRYNGNVSQAAKELGLTRASLYRRMEKYGI